MDYNKSDSWEFDKIMDYFWSYLEFTTNTHQLIEIERSFILFQVVKILDQMKLTYHLLSCPKEYGKNMRKNYYENKKETKSSS